MCHAELDPKLIMDDAARRMAAARDETKAETRERGGIIPALIRLFARGKRTHV